jgi:hypothetical protein
MPFQVMIAGYLCKLDPTMSALRKPKKTKCGPIEVTSSVVVVQVQNGRRSAKEYRLDKTLMTHIIGELTGMLLVSSRSIIGELTGMLLVSSQSTSGELTVYSW